jgi:hypothetical protein
LRRKEEFLEERFRVSLEEGQSFLRKRAEFLEEKGRVS